MNKVSGPIHIENAATEMRWPDDLKTIFCNHTQMAITDDAVYVDVCSVRIPTEPNQQKHGDVIVRVVFTRQHAIVFAQSLLDAVAAQKGH